MDQDMEAEYSVYTKEACAVCTINYSNTSLRFSK